MKKKRPPGQPRGEVRRSVDRDGVVRIDTAGGPRPLWVWLAALAAAAALLGLALWLWLRPAPDAGESRPGDPGREARTPTKGGPRRKRSAAPGAAARPGEGPAPSPQGESEGDRGLTADPTLPEDQGAPDPDLDPQEPP
ncbi:MAG TPA: hypothetical protein VLS89_03720, partial [Candidatus Nanopelagicales bacterium]|nr:hypothetical protein [Candidatus Nanopelagicales bacterium]